jgi:hypothetical protein
MVFPNVAPTATHPPKNKTRVPPTVHNTPMKIFKIWCFFLSHDLFNTALDSNGHH